MKRIRRIISLILSTVMLSAPIFTVCAAGWVTVSSWAYNDVSNFTKEGLLPDVMEDVTDYTQGITRLQFAELIYSLLRKIGFYKSDDSRTRHILFKDTDNRAATELAAKGIMLGEASGETTDGETEHNLFYPGRELTREEMAEVGYRLCVWFFTDMLGKYLGDKSEWETPPPDVGEISDWAYESVKTMMRAGIIEGVEDGRFAPKDSFSVEQAICLLYRIYNKIPTISTEDGGDVSTAEGAVIKTYKNGLIETRDKDLFYIKDGENVLMEFETDIYSNIYCDTKDAIPYAAAQNRYGSTDVYDLNAREIHSRLPYSAHGMDNEYIIVKSGNEGAVTFGLYDYEGNELLEPKYSIGEINEIRANDMQIPYEEKAEAGGWIYYANWEDNGCLYKIDSNGENNQKLSQTSVYGIQYANGRIFYHLWEFDKPDETAFYCMRTDGTNNQLFGSGDASLCGGYYGKWKILTPSPASYVGYHIEYGDYVETVEASFLPNMSHLFYDDSGIYYTESGEEGSALYYADLSSDIISKEKISKGINTVENVQLKDNIIYFIGRNGNNDGLYSYDGKELTKLAGDKGIADFGFRNERLQIVIDKNNGDSLDYEVYTAAMDGSDWRLDEEIAKSKRIVNKNDNKRKRSKNEELHWTTVSNMYHLSDEKYFIYIVYDVTSSGDVDDGNYHDETKKNIIARDADGNERVIGVNIGSPMLRINDMLYVYDSDYTDRKSGHFLVCDLNTGESETAVENVYSAMSDIAAGDNWFTFYNYKNNICRYNTDTGEVEEVFPNNNMHRYGKMQKMIRLNDGIYKIDADGNYSPLLDSTVRDCIYVENGAKDAMSF